MQPEVSSFFDPTTFTYTYLVKDPGSRACAVIDAVLGFDPVSGQVNTQCAQRIIDYVTEHELQVHWLLDTHVHADHLSASRFLQLKLGGRTAIGCGVDQIQKFFSAVFNTESTFKTNGEQFDRLLQPDEVLNIGGLAGRVLATPGHTPDSVTYVFAGCAFVGDTLFMPDYGTARTDFPGGDAQALYQSIQKIFELPDDTKMYLCHDYLTDSRKEYCGLTTVGEQHANNIHIHEGVESEDFVAQRMQRDKALSAPKLLYPSVQFNMRGGAFPPAEDNYGRYFKIPLKLDACKELT